MPYLTRNLSDYLPARALCITSYEEMRDEVRVFAAGKKRFLVHLGPPGVGKTCAAEAILGERPRWFKGSASPYALYCECYRSRDLPIVIDEGEGLLSKDDGVSLFKLLTQTSATKQVAWLRMTSEIRKGEIPAEYSTTSHFLFIANGWPVNNLHLDAVIDRASIVYFRPGPREVHEYARQLGLLKDREIADYVAARLDFMQAPSLRIYTQADEDKAAAKLLRKGPEYWQRRIDAALLGPSKMLALELAKDESLFDNERAQTFASRMGTSVWAYYNNRDTLAARGLLPDKQTRRLEKKAKKLQSPERQLVLELCSNPSFRSDNARATVFCQRTGMRQRTFYSFRDELVAAGLLPDRETRQEQQKEANLRNLTAPERAVIDLLSDKAFPTAGDKIAEFRRRTGLSKASFHHHRRALRDMGLVPPK